jgi:cellulose synthase/poly-beta-1,6-N-acetylglucosamine synthase-like glycosyltransferase
MRGKTAVAATLLGIAGFGHVLYPAWLALGRHGRREPPTEGESWPGVTVVVPAYRERRVIERKVDNLFENGYEGPLEVVVVPEDHDTAAAASRTGATVLPYVGRRGKSSALNRGVEEATHTLIVITDANTYLEPGALAALVRWFADEDVGAVTGEKHVSGEGFYWKFESWLKQRESDRDTTISLDGALAALRREDYAPLPADLVVDDLWLALDAIEQGKRVVYEPAAVSHEGTSGIWSAEWERRTRIIAGTLDVLWRRRTLLSPFSSRVAVHLWGHKLVRSSFGPIAHVLLLGAALAHVRRSRLAATFVGLHLIGARAYVRDRQRKPLTPIERLVLQVLFLQAVALGGTARFLRGDLQAQWKKGERSETDLRED